ncbi:MAG: hypothetical protein WC294_09195 [Methanoregula sp.]|jgi:hypothetical protein
MITHESTLKRIAWITMWSGTLVVFYFDATMIVSVDRELFVTDVGVWWLLVALQLWFISLMIENHILETKLLKS